MSNYYFLCCGVIFVVVVILLIVFIFVFVVIGLDEKLNLLSVIKDFGCGCCGVWVDLVIEVGFEVEIIEVSDYVGMKCDVVVFENLWFCYMIWISGYIVEGYVFFVVIR